MILWEYICNLGIALWGIALATAGKYQLPGGHGYVFIWWYSIDCTANAIALGDPRESISSRAAKARAAGREWGCVLCAILGYFATLFAGTPTDHCAQSLEANEGRRAIIPDGD